jgi:hypothetical protein
MNELNSKARALVDATQFADEPSAADCERIHAAISARIAVGVAVGTVAILGTEGAAASVIATPAANAVVGGAMAGASVVAVPTLQGIVTAGGTAGPGAAALGITSGSAIAAKVGVWVFAIGLTSGAVGLVADHVIHSRSPAIEATASSAAPYLGTQADGTTSPARRGPDPSPTPRAVSSPPNDPQSAPRVQTAPSARGPGARAAAPAVGLGPAGAQVEEPSVSTPMLDAELALVRRAHTALIEGHAEEALAALDEHASRFPDGVLAEDRAAQRIFALCALGRSGAAQEEGRRFVSSHPQSPHVAAIRGSCAFVADPGK